MNEKAWINEIETITLPKVEKNPGFSITIHPISGYTIEAILKTPNPRWDRVVYVKCLDLNEKSFLKYASEAVNRLLDRLYFTGKVVCVEVLDGAKNLRAGKAYEVKNGYITDDTGLEMTRRFSTIAELCEVRHAKFIPFID